MSPKACAQPLVGGSWLSAVRGPGPVGLGSPLRSVGSACHIHLCLPTAPLPSLVPLQQALPWSWAAAQGCISRQCRRRRMQLCLWHGVPEGLGVTERLGAVSPELVAWHK